MMHVRHGLGLLAFHVWVGIAWTSPVRADEDSKKICASAYASGQRLMRNGSLLEAKAKLELCAGPECPALMHPDCQQWLSTVEASIPTVVFQIVSATDKPVGEVWYAIDGGEPALWTGRAVSLDPGAHDIAFTSKDFRLAKKHIVVSEGEKLRQESVTLLPLVSAPTSPTEAVQTAPAPAPPMQGRPAEPGPSRITTPVVIASSVAALAVASAIYFGVKARSDDHDLDGCAPSSSCAQSAVDRVRSEYLWTNISIGVAAAGLTAAVVLFLVNGKSTPRSTVRLTLLLQPGSFGPAAVGAF